MVNRQFYSIISWIALIGGLGLAGFGLYSVGFNGNPVYAIPLLVVGLLIFGAGVILYVINLRKEKEEKKLVQPGRAVRRSQIIPSTVINPQRTEPEIVEIEMPKKVEKKKKQDPDKVIKIRKPPENETCMISKLPFSKTDKALQCPNCQSYFIEEYLEEWLDEKSFCPVCHSNIHT